MALLIPVQQFAIFQRLLVGEAVIFSLALFVAVGLLYLLLIRWITTPVKALMKVARKMMDGEPVEPVMITTGDEIGVLARTFNELTDKLDLRERELLQKAKEATYRSQELNAILEQMADAVVVTNQDYVIEYMNRTAIDIFGAQLGETCYKALNYRKDTCNPCSIKELLIKKKKLFKYSMQDSAGRFFEIIAQPLTGMDGKPKVISLRRDVTERIRHFQKEKELQQKIQEERIAAINQVVVSIKHGVNNSLAAISTALRLFDMDSEAFSDRDREIFNLLDDEVKKITDIVAKLSTITDPVVSNYTDSIQMIDLDQIK